MQVEIKNVTLRKCSNCDQTKNCSLAFHSFLACPKDQKVETDKEYQSLAIADKGISDLFFVFVN